MNDLNYLYSSTEFVPETNKFNLNSNSNAGASLKNAKINQINSILKSQLKSSSLSSTPSSSVSSSSSCSPNNYSHSQIEYDNHAKTVMASQPSLPTIKPLSYYAKPKANLANLREVLQATHQIRSNLKILDNKTDLFSKISSVTANATTTSFNSLQTLVEFLSTNEANRTTNEVSNNVNKTKHDLHESIKKITNIDAGKLNNEPNIRRLMPSQHTRSFRSSSPKHETRESNHPNSLRKFTNLGENCVNLNKLESLKKNFNQRRNSIDLIPFNQEEGQLMSKSGVTNLIKCGSSDHFKKASRNKVKQSLSFNYEKLDENSNQHMPFTLPDEKLTDEMNKKTCSKESDLGCNWNYDQLNELRMKFISLLSAETNDKVEDTKNDSLTEPKKALLTKANSMNSSKLIMSSTSSDILLSTQNDKKEDLSPALTNVSSVSFVSPTLQPIATEELLKIESFYRSFGTVLNISGTSACLYTMNNAKTCTQQSYLVKNDMKSHILNSNPKRSSFISNKHLHNTDHSFDKEIDPNILMDFMNSKHQNHVSVYHRGVPLWLFNSGLNPRRPTKQLKFTLAERGTGFILWQDRIDINSNLKIYSITKSDSKLINYATYIEKIYELNSSNHQEALDKIEKSNELFSSMLITFRASDKKTTVFVKFDMNSETAKFYDYYLQVIKRINTDVRQKTKSLPIGFAANNLNQFNKIGRKSQHYPNEELIGVNEYYFNYSNDLSDSSNKNNETNLAKSRTKRQSYYVAGLIGKSKRMITTNDISSPSNPKHIINVKLFDRKIFYTLSKLLPEKKSETLSSSPTYSGMSSVSNNSSQPVSASISNNSKLAESFGRLTNSLAENCSSIISTNTSPSSHFSYSSSNSSLSMPNPIISVNNNNISNKNYFNNESIVMKNFESIQKPSLSKQRTVK